MKLRLLGNSLRLRLRQPEVAALGAGATVEAATAFGPDPSARFVCRLAPADIPAVTCDFASGTLLVSLPTTATNAWAGSSDVGLYAETPWGLRIAIEKDFRCLEVRPDEDESGAFDRPEGFAPGLCATDAP